MYFWVETKNGERGQEALVSSRVSICTKNGDHYLVKEKGKERCVYQSLGTIFSWIARISTSMGIVTLYQELKVCFESIGYSIFLLKM